jgi:hypothetical protein
LIVLMFIWFSKLKPTTDQKLVRNENFYFVAYHCVFFLKLKTELSFGLNFK